MEDATLDIEGGLTFRYPMSICKAVVKERNSIGCFSNITFYKDAESGKVKASTLYWIELDDPNEDAGSNFEAEMEDDVSDWKATAYVFDDETIEGCKKLILGHMGVHHEEV